LIALGSQRGLQPVQSRRQSRTPVHGHTPARGEPHQSVGAGLPCRLGERTRHVPTEPRRGQHHRLRVGESVRVTCGCEQCLAGLTSGPHLTGQGAAQGDHRVATPLPLAPGLSRPPRPAQQGQTPPCSTTRVTSGLISGISMRS